MFQRPSRHRDMHADDARLAALADAAERAAWSDLYRGAHLATRAALGLELAQIGAATALTAARLPHPMLNRAIGAGPGDLAAIARHYASRGIHRFFAHVHRADQRQANDRAAAAAGLARYHRAWVKLARGDEPAPTVATAYEIDAAGPGDLDAIGALFCQVFDLPSRVAPMMTAAYGRSEWELLVARDRGTAVAFGFLYCHDGVGYMAGGGTAPHARRRGAQGALMAARIERARRRGCRWMVSETGEAVPGDPQHSYRNMERCGFRPISVRDNYALPRAAWTAEEPAA